jgi:hypothetical protein
MDKKPLIGVSISVVILLVMCSLSTVVGYQSVQTSQQNLIKGRINQRELSLQTIVDIANNKEIQRIILKSQMSRGIFPKAENPVVTKTKLKQMYFIGLLLSRYVSPFRKQSMVHYQNQVIESEIQQEISTTIDNNPTLKEEITQLQNLKCDCQNDYVTRWNFPILCAILLTIIAIIECSPALGFLFRGYLLLLWGITGTIGC